jgi:uncharacterized protein involved in exopolysaccharide biosynthesis
MNVASVNLANHKPKGLSEYLAAAKHRRAWLIGILTVGVLATAIFALVLPPRYRSAATILIEQQEMPQDLVRSTITSYADQRVQIISKRVMTTDTLLNIIRRYDLYPRERAKDTREALLERMQHDIGLKMISADVIDPRSGHPTSATIAFEVSYSNGSPELAAKVANELTTLYLNENLNNRTQIARDATDFLEAEGDRLSKQIASLESELAQFKEKNFNKLPELTQLNMQLLDRTDEELRTAAARQSSLEQQRVYLQAQLAQLKPNSAVFSDTGERVYSTADRLKMLKSQLAEAKARYAPDHPDIERLQREVDGLEKQRADAADTSDASSVTTGVGNDLRRDLDRAKTDLAAAREKYGPDHPDRIRLERQVAELESQLAALPAATPDATQDAAAMPVPKADADNPAYVQIEAQVAATDNELQSLATEITKLHGRANDYQRDVSLSPQIEKEYRELNRDYENARAKYAEVRSKQGEAKIAQNLEADRKGERFTLIDPPLPPERPISPNRRLIFTGGVILSAALAFGILWLLESADTTIRGRNDLQELLGVAPLALVPHIGTEAEARAGRRRIRLTAGAVVASACVAVVLTHLFYRPLDVLWFSFAHRLGF